MTVQVAWRIIIITLLPFILLAQGENWVYRYDGPGNGVDIANSVVYGADSNIYAAGIADPYDLIVVSLTTVGDTNWVYRYNGPANSGDGANAIVHGTDGNIYVAGNSYGNSTGFDFLVISLTTAGDTNWVYRYNGPANSGDGANAIVYGTDSNIYTAGYSIGSGTGSDFIVISLTSTGDSNWIYRYNGPGNDYDRAYCIAYGADGNIYAAGNSIGSGTGFDFLVISLTTVGDTNWVYRYNGPANSGDGANAIVYGTDGNIYVAGISSDSSTDSDFMVISLTTAGIVNWVYTYNDTGPSAARSITYGSDGNIYAAGYSCGINSNYDFTVISLTASGYCNWIYTYSGPGSDWDMANSITYGADGNIYAAGYAIGSSTDRDFTVISLGHTGNSNWVYCYNGSGNSFDEANAIVYGTDGNIYAAGYSIGSGTQSDFTVISLDPNYGVEEDKNFVKKNRFGSTILSGPLQLPKGKAYRIFDITGRVVMPDKMQPGIYFLEIDGKIIHKIIKVK